MRFTLTTFALCVASPTLSFAADDASFSGPQPGESLPPLKVRLVYGDSRGQVVDLVAQANGRPCLIVVVSGSNRPAARLTRALMNYCEMYSDKLFAAVVYLDKDRSAAEEDLNRAVSWWGVGPPVGISVDGAEGPGSYGFNRNVNLTVLIARRARVTANFALVQPSETDAPRIFKAVTSITGGSIPTQAEILFLSVPTRKPRQVRVRWSSAPQDVSLRRLICSALASDGQQHAAAAAAAIEEYVADNMPRQAALGRAASVLLEGRTRIRGRPIVRYLRKWQTAYDRRRK